MGKSKWDQSFEETKTKGKGNSLSFSVPTATCKAASFSWMYSKFQEELRIFSVLLIHNRSPFLGGGGWRKGVLRKSLLNVK